MTGEEMVQPPVRVLVVDDEPTLRNAMGRFLSNQGFAVDSAESGPEAIEKLRGGGFALMLLDIRMPGMSGLDVVPEAIDVDPDIAILILSGLADATSAAICMQRGAMDYLTKPIELHDLRKAIDRALRRRDTQIQSREISAWLKEEVQRRTAEVERERRRQQQLTVATLEALVNALEAKSPWLSGHSARVAALAATIAAHMDLADDDVEYIRAAGRLHDLGMIGIRESVLNKMGNLTREEFEHIKQHVLVGSQILSPLSNLAPVVSFIRSHHESWDGHGYPDGLAGNDIPLGARVICATEVFDALTTPRPYQKKLHQDDAVKRMRQITGKVIDPAVMDALAGAVDARKALIFIDDGHSPT